MKFLIPLLPIDYYCDDLHDKACSAIQFSIFKGGIAFYAAATRNGFSPGL